MKEMYVALSGAIGREKHLAVTANNLANINTAGFKKETTVFRVRPPEINRRLLEESARPGLNLPPVLQEIEGDRNYVAVAETRTDFSPGYLRPTGNSYDMALESRHPGGRATAFFAVQTPQGVRYTRMGNFQVSAQATLVTAEGLPVLSRTGAPVVLPAISAEPIVVSPSGVIHAAGQEVGVLRIVVADEPEQLEKLGGGLFGDRGGRIAVRDARPEDGISVRSHYLEMSNVNVVEELVRMIEIQRLYTAHEKCIQSMDDASSRAVAAVMGG